MKYTADCPECLAEFEVAGPKSAALGIQCKSCGHKFTPNTVHRLTSESDTVDDKRSAEGIVAAFKASMDSKITDEASRQKWKDYFALKDLAATLSMICLFCIIVAGLALVTGLAGETRGTPLLISGAAFSSAVTLFVVTQLIHIRAALEKLSIKE